MKRWNIESNGAHTPQARGRALRASQTLQGRLVKEMACATWPPLRLPTRWQPEFIQTWKAKFAAPPQGPVDAQSSVDGALWIRWRINWQGAGNGRCPKPSLSGPAAPCRCIVKTAICQSRPARHSLCPIPPQTKPPSMRASMASSPANLRRLRQAQGWILEQKACIAAARCRRARRCSSKSMETGARHQFLFTQKGYFPAVPKEASGLAHART